MSTNLPSISVNNIPQYLRQINSIPSLTQEEEFLLAKNYLEKHDIEAANKLIISHLKLVAKLAFAYKNYGLPLTDLISEGNLGLIHAVKKYNPDLGFRVSTYARWWIKAYLQEFILKSWSLIKIGTTANQKKLFFNLSKVKNKILNQGQKTITDDDYESIANELNVSKKEVVEMNNRLNSYDVSLNNPLQDDSGYEFIDIIPSPSCDQEIIVQNQEEKELKKKILQEALLSLNPRELLIIQKRKLMEPISTLEDLSSELNISRERVRQIEKRAMCKMKSCILDKMQSDSRIDEQFLLS